MYADTVTDSMRRAIDETYRRRKKQMAYNEEHGITPHGIQKAIRDIGRTGCGRWPRSRQPYDVGNVTVMRGRTRSLRLDQDLESQMKQAAKDLDFERGRRAPRPDRSSSAEHR